MSVVCLCKLLKYNLIILVLMSTHHTHPLLGRYAQSHAWAPHSEILNPPLYMSSLFKFFVSRLSYCEVYTLLSILV